MASTPKVQIASLSGELEFGRWTIVKSLYTRGVLSHIVHKVRQVSPHKVNFLILKSGILQTSTVKLFDERP